MVPASVARNLEEGQTFDTFVGPVRIGFVRAGELVVPSGRVAAGDPEFLKDALPLAQPIPAGRHPVILTMLKYKDKDERIAAARIQLAPRIPTIWQEARPAAYGIDSGLGCFLDADAASHMARQPQQAYDRYWQNLNAALNRNYADTRSWAEVRIDPRSGANLIAFSSGFGDGGCGSYLGYDSADRLCCILTDFELLLTKEEVEAMEAEADE